MPRSVAANRKDCTAALAAYPQEQFYAFCLYTDNDVTSVYPTANTAEGFQRIWSSDAPEDRVGKRGAQGLEQAPDDDIQREHGVTSDCAGAAS